MKPLSLMLIGIVAAARSAVAATQLETYFYDPAGRLETVFYAGAPTNSIEQFAHDLMGNRIGHAAYDSGNGAVDLSNALLLAAEALQGIDPATTDTDGNGASDYDKWIAGISITNRSDSFTLTIVSDRAAGILQFAAPVRQGRTYQIQGADSLGAAWQDWGPPFKATAAENHVFELPLAASGFVRLQVSWGP